MIKSSSRIRVAAAAVMCAATLAVAAGPLIPAASAAPVCPAAAGNARFVRFIYFSILERCPGGTASRFWTSRLDAGLSRFAFAEAIDTSNENVIKNNAVPIFEGFLGRPPTALEAAEVAEHIRTEHEDGKLVASVLAFDEYYSKLSGATPAAKDQAWLTAAFNAIEDRNPNAGARDYFTRRLGAGGSTLVTRFQVASILERSQENARDWTGAVFFAGLNRPPDPKGFAYWLTWLTGRGQWRTFSMWTHILSSNEGYARAQTQPNPPSMDRGQRGTTLHVLSRRR